MPLQELKQINPEKLSIKLMKQILTLHNLESHLPTATNVKKAVYVEIYIKYFLNKKKVK